MSLLRLDGVVAKTIFKLLISITGRGILLVRNSCIVNFRCKTYNTVGYTSLCIVNPLRHADDVREDYGTVY